MYLFFDTETTGLPKNWKATLSDLNNWPRLVQLAFLYYDEDGKKISGGDFIIKPEGFIIPEDASRVHGITTERANKEGIALTTVLQLFNTMINQAEVLVAHNMNFDEKIVGAEFLRLRMENPIPAKKKICTMESATNFCALSGPYGYKWPKLAELHEKLFKTGFEEAHNAANDINATAKCFWELKRIGILPTSIPAKNPSIELPEINIEKLNVEVQETSINKLNIEKAHIPFPKPNIDWVYIPGGTFTMGSPEDEERRGYDETQQEVYISAFKMSKYAVTFEQYDLFCEATGRKKPNDEGWGRGNRPVINVNWYEARAFANWMDCLLPTEKQWEYACRAGTLTPFNTGKNITTKQANFNGEEPCNSNPKGENRGKTMPVGSFASNAWGLYDMHGNVWEWCIDRIVDDLSDLFDPSEMIDNNKRALFFEKKISRRRIVRGGAWYIGANCCRSATRCDIILEGDQNNGTGFRLISNDYTDEKKVFENDNKSRYLRKEKSIDTFDYQKKIAIKWASIPSGTFSMGSPESEVGRSKDETKHPVTINAFKMSAYAITFEHYDLFCDATGAEKTDDEGWGRGKRPVINVSWDDAVAFASWIGCRLPSEAEWEYACRAGTTTPFNTGKNITTSQANYCGVWPYKNYEEGAFRGETLPVGSFAPNAWGLYDMHGNVNEWCNDWFGDYFIDGPNQPVGHATSWHRVSRGGSCFSSAESCRSACREAHASDLRDWYLGFRVVLAINSHELKVIENDNSEYTKSESKIYIHNNINQKPMIEWASIPAGSFIMGSPIAEAERKIDEIQHLVSISAFKMSIYAITFVQYSLFCEACGKEIPYDENWGRGKRPVINVSWFDAKAFADWMGCRLPSEAEWEYACRAGTTTPFNTGMNLTTSQANYDGNAPYNNTVKGEYRAKTLPVGSFSPNAWGLYDMHGNVGEWCSDVYGSYPTAARTNLDIVAEENNRVFRGGHFSGDARWCRSAKRTNIDPNCKRYFIGFRLVSDI